MDFRHRDNHRQYRGAPGISKNWNWRALPAELRSIEAARPALGNAHLHVHGLQQWTGELATRRCRLHQRFHADNAADDARRTELSVTREGSLPHDSANIQFWANRCVSRMTALDATQRPLGCTAWISVTGQQRPVSVAAQFSGERPFVPNNPQCFPIGRLYQQSTIPTEVEPLSAGAHKCAAARGD